jgi:hypothetical protein
VIVLLVFIVAFIYLVLVSSFIVYRGLYFGMYDSIKPIMPEHLQNSFLVSFLLGWVVTTGAGLGKFLFIEDKT